MRRTCSRFVAFAIFLFFGAAHAQMTTLAETKRVFARECSKGAPCVPREDLPQGLKEFGFWVQDYRLPYDNAVQNSYAYNSALYAWYETDDHKRVEDFGFVQYVRGCVFSSELQKDGRVTEHLSVTRMHLGARAVFFHRDWEIDSSQPDPMYDSGLHVALVRHWLMSWTTIADAFPKDSAKIYGIHPPKRPRLFILPRPFPFAYYSTGSEPFAMNHSLEYRTCLHRVSDIPLTATAKSVIPNPIGCHEWRSSRIYDHVRGSFVSTQGIAPVCLQKEDPDASKPWK